MKILVFIRFIFLIIFIFICNKGFSQLQSQELQLIDLGKRILSYENTSKRIKLNQSFDSILNNMIRSERSFDYPFDSIKSMSVVTSPDSIFRIYNWAFPQHTNYRYFAYIHFKKDNKVIKLVDKSPFIRDYKYKALSPESWYGVLYYRVVLHKIKGQKIYTLLGWDINTPKTKKRIIEVLTLNNDRIVFGKPIFDLGVKNKKKYSKIIAQYFRLIYEYTASSGMVLDYEKKKDRIIISHLVPLNTSVPSFMSQKGPDDTFDALYFKDGKWTLKIGVDYTIR